MGKAPEPKSASTETDEATDALLQQVESDEATTFTTHTFPGDAADTPIRGCINGENFEYPRGVPVEIRNDHLAVIKGFSLADDETAEEELSSPEPEA